MKPVGGAKIPWIRASCRILATTTGFITHECQKNQILTLYLLSFFKAFLCINCDDSVFIMQNTRRRKVIKQRVRP